MLNWYAIKTTKPSLLASELNDRNLNTYLPFEEIQRPDGSIRRRPLISRLLFLQSTAEEARAIEREARKEDSSLPHLWIYRYKSGDDIQSIREKEFRLFQLLTAPDSMRCEIYQKEEYKIGDRLRVIGGPFAGYEGYARRIRKNKHIVVEIEGLCAIALPFIHPDLLEKIP